MGTIRSDSPPPKKRRKVSPEQIPAWERTRTFATDKRKNSTLPVIQSNGSVKRNIQPPKFTVRAQKKPLPPPKQTPPPTSPPPPPVPQSEQGNRKRRKTTRQKLEQYARELQNFEAAKEHIAHLASKLVADPQANVLTFKQLRQFAQRAKGRVAALAILTESQLYKDIAPAYRIRSITEKEAETKVSKEVAKLRQYEQTLLDSYRTFVKSCVSLTRWRSGGGSETEASRNMAKVRFAVCKALAELAAALPHFNDADIVVNAVCTLIADRDEQVRRLCADSLKTVLGDAHRASGVTLDTCVLAAKNLASVAVSKLHMAPAEVVQPLVEIQFARFARLPLSSDKPKNAPKKSKRFIKKRRRKPDKEDAIEETELEKDMREADAEATPQELYNARKKMLDSVCHAYFNIIKAAASTVDGKEDAKRRKKPPVALSPTLKGLLRVATFIGTDVIEAILGALTPLLQRGRLPLAVRFRCLSAAYAVLGVHARSQQADPDSFTGDARAMDVALYRAIGCLYGPEMPVKEVETVTYDAAEAVVACSAFREVPAVRCAALARRLLIMAANSPTHSCAFALLRVAQGIVPGSLMAPIFKQTVDGVENELGTDLGVIQTFEMGGDDPEIADAERSAAWEVSCLTCHFHPAVRETALKCASGYCGARMPKTAENIMLVVRGYSGAEGGFNPPPSATPPGKLRRKVNMKESEIVRNVLGDTEKQAAFLNADNELPKGYFEKVWNKTASEQAE